MGDPDVGGRISKDRIFREGDCRVGRERMAGLVMVLGLLLGIVWRYLNTDRSSDAARIV